MTYVNSSAEADGTVYRGARQALVAGGVHFNNVPLPPFLRFPVCIGYAASAGYLFNQQVTPGQG